ncbi:hypothetical protein N7493_003297 [Penicillium malachiteum]|uniref:Cytochrome P450 n=1 Tax=Penicillium malachiteum TaxID=1324776 RepID=A0AAD6HQ20_9EURO|nr:hypothetical protein N7493_003297 [Penicillium malachiteum]
MSIILSGSVLLAIVFCFILYRRSCLMNLPPGPPSLSIIGNLHQLPSVNLWTKLTEWRRKYGPIITVNFGQRKMIILGSQKIAQDLLGKRAEIYSSRPNFLGEHASNDMHTAFLAFGPTWKAHRAIQSTFLNPRASQSYRPLQDLESKQTLYELLSADDFHGSLHRYAHSVTYTAAYGRRLPMINACEIQEMDGIAEAVASNASTLKIIFPILESLPRWMRFESQAAKTLKRRQNKFFSENMRMGLESKPWSWAKSVQQTKEDHGMDHTSMSYIVGVAYEASTHTTAIALKYFIMASVLHPVAVKRAQEELDLATGARMPTFDDISDLPYVNAFLNEVLRWRPPLPLGLYHEVIKDDQYQNFFIPAGTTIVGNEWSIAMDEEVFAQPSEFLPERWIENPKLRLNVFGFGKRVCPGKNIARNSLFIVIARLLWGYQFDHAYDNGRKIEIDPMNSKQGLTAEPLHFRATVSVRSPKHWQVIDEEWAAAEKDSDILLDRIRSMQE